MDIFSMPRWSSLSASTSNGSCFKAPFSCLQSVGVGVHFKVLFWHPLQMCCSEEHLLYCELGTKGKKKKKRPQEHLINAYIHMVRWAGSVRVCLLSSKGSQKAGGYKKNKKNQQKNKKTQIKWCFHTFLWATAFHIWRIMWLLFLSPHLEKNQTYYVFLWRRGGAWPRGLSWLSKQTYQEQVETGCHWCHIRPVLNQRKPQDMYLLRPGSCHTMPHACLIKWALGTAEWRAAGPRGRAALLSMSRSFFFLPLLSQMVLVMKR